MNKGGRPASASLDADQCRAVYQGTGVVGLVRRHARVRELDAASLLEDTELFSGLSKGQRDELETLLVPCRFAPGTWLTREGEVAKHLVLILEGAVTEHAEEPRTMGRGDVVGQAEVLLEGGPWRSSAVAVSAGRGFRLPRRAFERFGGENSNVRVRVQPWRAREHIKSDAARRRLEEYL